MDVKTLRQDAGLTQRDMARLAGVSVRTVRRWENGETAPALMVTRWLALEAGRCPGAPAGFLRRQKGIRTPGGDLIPWGMIEQARYVVQLLTDAERTAAGVSASDPEDQPRRRKVESIGERKKAVSGGHGSG